MEPELAYQIICLVCESCAWTWILLVFKDLRMIKSLDARLCSFKHLHNPLPPPPTNHGVTGFMHKLVWWLKSGSENLKKKNSKKTATCTHPQNLWSIPCQQWHDIQFIHLCENTHMKSRVLTSTKENFWHFQKTNLRLSAQNVRPPNLLGNVCFPENFHTD